MKHDFQVWNSINLEKASENSIVQTPTVALSVTNFTIVGILIFNL